MKIGNIWIKKDNILTVELVVDDIERNIVYIKITYEMYDKLYMYLTPYNDLAYTKKLYNELCRRLQSKPNNKKVVDK